MRAFVTGGTGLVGSHLVDVLLAHGWEVRVLTRSPTKAQRLTAQGMTAFVGDLTRPKFQNALRGCDVVFHAAGWIELGVRDGRPMFDVNVTGTANLLTLVRKEHVPRFVFTGTAGVFAPAPPDSPATETSEARAVTEDPYVVTKFQAHNLVVGEMHAGLPISVVLPAAVFGPRDTNDLGRTLARLARNRLRVVPSGFGCNTWTHGADIAEGHLLAATRGKPGETYLLGDRILTFYEFLRHAAEASGVRPPRWRVPASIARLAARGSEIRAGLAHRAPRLSRAALDLAAIDLAVDASKARKQLGWQPRPFEDRIRETMAWYVREYRARGARMPFKSGDAYA